MQKIVNTWNYAQGNNGHAVQIGKLTIYFSYRTPIAYDYDYRGLVARQNDWGPTTGRHMNMIPGNHKEDRIEGAIFEEALNALMEELGL